MKTQTSDILTHETSVFLEGNGESVRMREYKITGKPQNGGVLTSRTKDREEVLRVSAVGREEKCLPWRTAKGGRKRSKQASALGMKEEGQVDMGFTPAGATSSCFCCLVFHVTPCLTKPFTPLHSWWSFSLRTWVCNPLIRERERAAGVWGREWGWAWRKAPQSH